MRALTPAYCARTRHTINSAGRWMKCHRRFKMQALTHWDASITSTRTAVGQFKGQFKGGNGGNVTEGSKCKHSHPARPKSRARAQQSVSSRASSVGLWRNCHRRFKMQTLTYCDGAEVTSTRTTVGQFKGAMDESAGKDQDANTLYKSRCCRGCCSLQS